MNTTTTSQQFASKMNRQSMQIQALSKALDKAIEIFGAQRLALALCETKVPA